MPVHAKTHSAVGTDHIVSAASATNLLGINTSGLLLDYYSVIGSANVQTIFSTTNFTIATFPDYEELTLFAGVTADFTNQPAAITEFGLSRSQFNLTYFSSCRMAIAMSVAGTSGSHMFAQLSTNGGTTWVNAGATGTTSPAASMLTTGTISTSPWVAIRTNYRRDVLIRAVGSGGDGVVDPQIGHIGVQFY